MRVYKCPTCGMRWSRTTPFIKESCIVRATPTCVYLKDGTKVVARYWERTLCQPVKPYLEVIPQSVIKAQEPLGKHGWIQKHGHWICFKCGIVRRADNKNKPCPGWIEVRTRVIRAGPPFRKPECRLEDLLEWGKKQKSKTYPEVDRFIGKKRKMEKKQAKHPEQILTLKTGRSFWDRTDPTVRKPLGDGDAYNEIERKAKRRRKP